MLSFLLAVVLLVVLFRGIASASSSRSGSATSSPPDPFDPLDPSGLIPSGDLLQTRERSIFDLSPRHGFLDRLLMEDAERRGEDGEGRLFGILEDRLPLGGADGFRIIRGLMMEDAAGGTTQIDFVLVSAFGLFIVEAKNYTGWVFGSAEQPRWTVSLPGGRKFQFQNPTRQNFKHVCVLSEKTGVPRNLIFPVVAFGEDAEFKTEMPPNVVHFRGVAPYVMGFRQRVIKASQLGEIVQALLEWDAAVCEEKRRGHVGNLKAAHAAASVDAAGVSCPVCGSRMVLRHRKSDGGAFFGCSRFPACKGTRQAVG